VKAACVRNGPTYPINRILVSVHDYIWKNLSACQGMSVCALNSVVQTFSSALVQP
jgi:hypothetical protein